MIPAILFILSIVASAVIVIFYKSFLAKQKTLVELPLMIFWAMAPLAVVYAFLFFVNKSSIGITDVITGIVAGICNALAIAFLLKAMNSGEVSIAVVIINLNFCIPIILSLLFLKESVSLLQILGIAILVIMIIIVNLIDQPKEKSKNAVKILIYSFIACITNGLVNFMIKVQQFYTGSQGINAFYLVMYGGGGLICLLIFAIMGIIKQKSNLEQEKIEQKPSYLPIMLIGLAVGLCSITCMYPQSLLTAYVTSAIQFTVTASGAVLLSVLIAFIKYKEKPNVKNVVSALCCIAAILLQLIG